MIFRPRGVVAGPSSVGGSLLYCWWCFFFWKWFFALTHKQSNIGEKMSHSKWSRTSFTLHDGTCAKAWQKKRQVSGMVACLARLARLSAIIFASLLILITENCFVPVISSNSARTGRSDQCPGCRRHDLAWAAEATTWLSVSSVATCKFRAAASLAPRRRAWASASKGSKTCDVATWKKMQRKDYKQVVWEWRFLRLSECARVKFPVDQQKHHKKFLTLPACAR